MKPSDDCLALTKHFEGCRLEAYQDSGDIWTIGYGATRYLNGQLVKQGDTITQEMADEMLYRMLRIFSGYVDDYLSGINVNQHQYDALVDFCYNRGPGNFKKSKLFQLISINPNSPIIRSAFIDHENIIDHNGDVLDGLINRRKSESYLYFSGVVKFDFQ